MADPKTIIETAATAAGITSVVEVADDAELNFLLDDKTAFPLVAIVKVGEDLTIRNFVPGSSVSWFTKWQCLIYVLDKAKLDDLGSVRHTDLNAIHDVARNLLSEVIKAGTQENAMYQENSYSITRLPVNEFDLNTNGVVFQLVINDDFRYC